MTTEPDRSHDFSRLPRDQSEARVRFWSSWTVVVVVAVAAIAALALAAGVWFLLDIGSRSR